MYCIFLKVPSEDSLVGAGKKLLLFDVLNSSAFNNDCVNRDKLIESLNILLVWNIEQMDLESQVMDEDGTGEGKQKKVHNLIHNSICC
jgi:hypothetical protein